MLRIGKKSKLSPAQIVEKAVAFLGPGGYGLEVKDQGKDCVTFEGGGGYVTLTISETEEGTEVDLETREWDYPVKEFLGKV